MNHIQARKCGYYSNKVHILQQPVVLYLLEPKGAFQHTEDILHSDSRPRKLIFSRLASSFRVPRLCV